MDNNDPNKWVWSEEAGNYYRYEWDGREWKPIWAEQQQQPVPRAPVRRDSALGRANPPEIPAQALGEAIQTHEGDIDSETLDPGYMIQRPRFFTRGRMFSVLFTEPLGETANLSNRNVDNISTVLFGQRVFSNIRRFIVVKEGRGFAYACPVSTYRGRATTKHGLDPQTHAIVYITGTYPQYIAGEQQLQKTAIPINPANSSVVLQPASRVNFAIHHPIQHNVKVKDLGIVHPEFVPTLILYARESGLV